MRGVLLAGVGFQSGLLFQSTVASVNKLTKYSANYLIKACDSGIILKLLLVSLPYINSLGLLGQQFS